MTTSYAQRKDTPSSWWLVLLQQILAALFGFLLLMAPGSPLFYMRSGPLVAGA
jgi:uncharacterized membrane protein HdeD (DUF308 family)